MKARIFFSGWNDYYFPWPDKSIDNIRAYNLLRSWRRNSRLPSNHAKWIFERIGKHEFRVSNPAYPKDFHIIKWSA